MSRARGRDLATRAAAALLALVLLGQAPPDKGFTAPVFGKKVGPYRLGLSVGEDLHPGREIRVRVILENSGPSEVLIGEGARLFAYDSVLLDERGAKVDRTLFAERNKDRLFPTSGHVARVAPGATLREGFLLNVVYDTTLPGRYRLTVSRPLPVSGKLERVSSGEITFDLTEEP